MNLLEEKKKIIFFAEKKHESKGGQLIIIYGHRRIGKTETLSHFLYLYTSRKFKSAKNQLLSFDIPQKKLEN